MAGTALLCLGFLSGVQYAPAQPDGDEEVVCDMDADGETWCSDASGEHLLSPEDPDGSAPVPKSAGGASRDIFVGEHGVETIRAALALAASGDRVLVPPGTYVGSLDYAGKSVAVHSTDGPEVTTIFGDGGTAVDIGPGGELVGFTVTGGAASFGAGMDVHGTGTLVRGNIFDGNRQFAGGFGAGIGGNSASPIIEENLFRNQTCDSQFLSGVISFVNFSSPLIANNVFEDNPCRAINMTLPVGNTPQVINNTMIGNSVGIRVDRRISAALQVYVNNAIVDNGIGLEVDFGSEANNPTWIHNLVFGNAVDYDGISDQTGAAGNLSADPLFADEVGRDLHLLPASPAVDGGDPTDALTPMLDFDGDPRPVDGDGDGMAVADIGADEFVPPDADFDGSPNEDDNCPFLANPGQADGDADGAGDLCDNCPATPNPIQADADGDGAGDACDADADDDGSPNESDNCPVLSNPGQGDADGDAVGDRCDNCEQEHNPAQENADGDRLGDACDSCPLDPNDLQLDLDLDGVGGACDNCPDTPNPAQEDGDGDGVGDLCDTCPALADPDQADRDGDGVGDLCDPHPDLHLVVRPVAPEVSLLEGTPIAYRLEELDGTLLGSLDGVRVTLTLDGAAVFGTSASAGVLVSGGGTSRALVEFVGGVVVLDVSDTVPEVVNLGGDDTEGMGIEVFGDVLETFETDRGGFTTEAGVWEHGVPTAGPATAVSGIRVWATNLEGNYPFSANDSLVSPAFRLPAGLEPRLEVQSWFDSASCCDRGHVEISLDDGASWTTLDTLQGNLGGYATLAYDLTSAAGSDVRVRFRFASGPVTSRPGWYLDDFAIRGVGVAMRFLAPAGDDDGDGLTNAEEVALGTDPLRTDTDDDGVPDGADNCPSTENPDQADTVHPNGVGDVCDDPDGDGVFDFADNCADTPNVDQVNGDGDRLGDVCDPFPDLDLVVRPEAPELSLIDQGVPITYRLEERDGTPLTDLAGVRVTLTLDGRAIFGAAAVEGLLLSGGATSRVLVEFVDGVVVIRIRDVAPEVVILGGEDTEAIGVEVVGDVFEDFEGDDGGFEPSADLWELGAPTSGPGAAFSGSRVWATNLEGNYPNRADSSLVTPRFPFSPESQPVLEVQSWFDSESCCDRGRLDFSLDDGATWVTLVILSGNQGGYAPLTQDLQSLAGQDVRFRFRLTSDFSVTRAGWYLDDFSIRGLAASMRFLAPGGDADGDGLANAAELGLGTDPLDPDTDGDAAPDGVDNCPLDSNFRQRDFDGDGLGRACDPDDGGPEDLEVSVELGGTAFDMEFDAARQRVYVSLPNEDEIAYVSSQCYEVQDRVPAGSPHGLELSGDGSQLFAALNDTGSILFLDPDTNQTAETDIEDVLGHFRTYDIVEAREDRLFVSANPGSGGFAWITMVDLVSGEVRRVASNRIIRSRPVLQEDRDQRFLYVGAGFSPNSLFKLDLDQEDVPIVREDRHGSVSGTDHLAVSPDGSRIHLGSGQVLSTLFLDELARLPAGVPQFGESGGLVYVAREPNLVEVYNTTTLDKIDEIVLPCSFTSIDRLIVLPDGSGWLVLGGDRLCGVVAEPTGPDGDLDAVLDPCDNCPLDPNSDQADRDGDRLGDVCDPFPDHRLIVRPVTPDLALTGEPTPLEYRLEAPDGALLDSLVGVRVTLTLDGSAVFGASASQGLLLEGGGTNRVRVEFVDGVVALEVSDPVAERVELAGEDTEGNAAEVVAAQVEFLDGTADPDGDGLTTAEELALGTDPRNPDSDGDAALDGVDNCPFDSNFRQHDFDGDGLGRACDPDDGGPRDIEVDVDLGGDGFDVELDEARHRIYVSLPFEDEIAYVSTLCYEVEDRVEVGSRPLGLDLSHDGTRLFAALNASGSVLTLDPDTKVGTETDLSAVLGHTLTYDVVEVDERLFVSANPGSGGLARIGMLDLVSGAARTVASNRIIRSRPVLQDDRDRRFLYVGEGFSPNSLYKLDLGQADVPIVLEDRHGSVSGTQFLAVSPDGSRIHTSGQALRTDTFDEVGRLPFGVPGFGERGDYVYVTRTTSRVEVYNTTTFELIEETDAPCFLGPAERLIVLPDDSGWLVLSDDRLCGVVAEPTGPDGDLDQVLDPCDNCPLDGNSDQADRDGDRLGDVCDPFPDHRLIVQPVTSGFALVDEPTPITYRLEAPDGALLDALDGVRATLTLDASAVFGASASQGALLEGAGTNRVLVEFVDGLVTLEISDPVAEVVTLAGEDTEGNAAEVAAAQVEFLDPAVDLDGDGLTNAEELDRGSDPRNPDTDGDAVPDGTDNCPSDLNPMQLDADGDGIGDVCDPDDDGDGAPDDEDNCLDLPNPDQLDADQDGVGDACDNCPEVANPGGGFAGLLDSLNDDHASISSLVPDRFDFFGGETGTHISDGGNDMYDGGNFLNTNLALAIPYTNGVILASDDRFGFGSRYFTAKYPGLFVLSVSDPSIDVFEITGNNGADGRGTADGAVLDVGALTVFVKRVYGTSDPSINHIIIVPSHPAVTHSFPLNTNDGRHTVHGLGSVRELHYLLVARRSGGFLADADILNIVAAFLGNLGQADRDEDGVGDVCDSCPEIFNPDQTEVDSDGDGLADICDACPNDFDNDLDADGLCGDVDNCPATPNPDQADVVHPDGIGDVCDDPDGDGAFDSTDNCPDIANPSQADVVHPNGIGDACDDPDADGAFDAADNCVDTANADQADGDGDAAGDVCDICPEIANPDQRERAGCIAVVEDGGQCLETSIDLLDPSADGELELFALEAVVPTSIAFEVLATSCFATDRLSVSLNGTPLATVDLDPARICTCTPLVQTFAVSDPALLESIWNLPGPNVLAIEKTATVAQGTALAWVRARVEGPAATLGVCIFDQDGGDCSTSDLCESGFTFGSVEAETTADDPLGGSVPISSTPYQDSQLPELIDLQTLPDGLGRICATADTGSFLFGSSRLGELFTVDPAAGAGTFVGLLPIQTTEIEYGELSGRALAQGRDGSFFAHEFDILDASSIGGPIANGGSFTGLEYVGSTLYGTVIFASQSPSELRTLSPFSGSSSLIGATGVGPVSGLAYDESSGTMYGIEGGPGPADLLTLDLGTGAATVVGSTGFQAGSLQFGPDGNLYGGGTGPDGGNLYRIDPATAASTLVGPTGFDSVTGLTLVQSLGVTDCVGFTKQGEEDLSINGAACGPPRADAGSDAPLECSTPSGATVVLDGTGSSDPNSTPGTRDDIVSFEWLLDFGLPAETLLGAGEVLDVALPVGVHRVTLRVTDSFGETDVDEVVVTVTDTTPPAISVEVDPEILWPPNHKMVTVLATITAGDLCGPANVILESVTDNEPDDGTGDGSTTGDIQGAGLGAADFSFELRAERSGQGDGRAYTVVYRATDASGNVARASAVVGVPHDLDDVSPFQDNCPYAFNPLQEDSGGLDSAAADGIGDACQCGDVDLDGAVTAADASSYRQHLARPDLDPLTLEASTKCSVVGGMDSCTVADVAVLRRMLAGLGPGDAQRCRAALP